MNRKTTPLVAGAVTPEKDKGRDAHHSDPTPNENQPTDFRPLRNLPQRPAKRAIPHRLALLALQVLNDTGTLGAVLLIVLCLHKLVEVLL